MYKYCFFFNKTATKRTLMNNLIHAQASLFVLTLVMMHGSFLSPADQASTLSQSIPATLTDLLDQNYLDVSTEDFSCFYKSTLKQEITPEFNGKDWSEFTKIENSESTKAIVVKTTTNKEHVIRLRRMYQHLSIYNDDDFIIMVRGSKPVTTTLSFFRTGDCISSAKQQQTSPCMEITINKFTYSRRTTSPKTSTAPCKVFISKDKRKILLQSPNDKKRSFCCGVALNNIFDLVPRKGLPATVITLTNECQPQDTPDCTKVGSE